jgi:hypothetical protein
MTGSGLRRGTSLGVLAAALALLVTGCPTSGTSQKVHNFSGMIVNGEGAAAGPDAQGGTGNATIVSTTSATATTLNNDFALANDSIILNFDAVGMDTASSLNAVQLGVPVETIAAPSGGNLVDIQVTGSPNDQFNLGGQAVVGYVDRTNPATITDPLANGNIVFNYEVVPDSDPGYEAFLTLNPIGQGLAASGAATPTFNMRRMLVKGVILHEGNPAVNFDGTTTVSAGAIVAPGNLALLPAGTIPASFQVNVPIAAPIVVKDLSGHGGPFVPVFVTTVYSLATASRIFSILTVIANPDPQLSATGVAQVVDIVVTGGGGDTYKNLDVLAGAPSFVPAGGPIVNNQPTGGLVATPFPGDFVQPSIFNQIFNAILAGLSAPPTIAITEQTFGIGAAPYVTFVGRDEPGVSYTWFDPNVGQLIFKRPAAAVTAVVQVRSATQIDDPTTVAIEPTFSHLRFVAVGGRNDASSSTDVAIIALRNQLNNLRGTPHSPNPPNTILNTATASGRILHAPAGTIVTISEMQPVFFAPFNPTGPFIPQGPGAGQPNPFTNLPGFFGPAAVSAATGGVIGAVPPTVVNEVLRTTAIPQPDGQWAATVPVGFDLLVPLGVTATSTEISIPSSTYHVQYLLPGADTPFDGGTATALAGQQTINFGAVDARVASLAFVNFEIIDLTSGRANLRVPGEISITAAGNGALPPGFSVGPPTGLAEPLERATGARNVVCSASGMGQFSIAPGAYSFVCSAGTEWEADTVTAVNVNLTAGEVLNLTGGNAFKLVQVVTPQNAISFDGHVHSGNSFDSSTPLADRVRSLLAVGLGSFAATEHDKIIDAGPALAEVAAERPDISSRLKAVSGTEATTLVPLPNLNGGGIGHYTSFPLKFGATVRKGGSPEDEFRPTRILVTELAGLAEDGTPGDDIVNLAHPRLPTSTAEPGLFSGQGYFENLAASPFQTGPFDFNTFNVFTLDLLLNGQLIAQPNPEGAFFIAGSLSWDTFEIMTGANGPQAQDNYLKVRQDWFEMLNRGIVKTVMGNSDMHLISSADGLQPGFPRNYLLINGVTPANLTDAEIVNALKPKFASPATTNPTTTQATPPVSPTPGNGHQRAFATTGPFLSVAVQTDSATGTVGDFITAGATTISVTVTVDAPVWVMEQLDATAGGLDEAVTWVNGLPFSMTELGGSTATHKVFTTSIDISALTTDAWVVVEVGKDLVTVKPYLAPGAAVSGSTFDRIAPGTMVIAVTNPVFLDVVNPGSFDPPNSDFSNN